ncbi:MAG TPA: hypothetical protein VK731_14620 [Candidatus Cybelea sp.]|jgi:hypothetical protein|nr:hypothetical protein [Candidatus Cybelea sp.]
MVVRLLRHFVAFPLRWQDHASSDQIKPELSKDYVYEEEESPKRWAGFGLVKPSQTTRTGLTDDGRESRLT